MSINLTDGLDDLSKELGESSANQTSRRIQHYNDAVQDFSGERKWPFLVKKNEDLTTIADTKAYNIPSGMSDARWPGAIKYIFVGTDTDEYIPIDYEKRGDASLVGKKYFYIDPETTQIIFMGDLGAAGQTITIHYFYIPARTEDLTTPGTFPIPDRYRKVISTLAAAYVQWGRYLEAQGNRLYNMYSRMLGKTTNQQAERPNKQPRRLEHPLAYRGFKRTYR